MKKIVTLSTIIACSILNKVIAQANKNLSNLTTPTAVNVNLLPGTNSIDLGSTAKYWNNIYFGGALFYGKNKVASVDSVTGSTSFGFKALGQSTTDAYNTSIGMYALYSNTIGSHNTANGAYALYSNTKGILNTASGFAALSSNTTGSENTGVGYQSLVSNTSGSDNTAIGSGSLRQNTTGTNNTATGVNALRLNTTGYDNTGLGYESLTSNTSGYYNSASGANSLYNNTIGSYNTANGTYALYSNTTGFFNTASGFAALSLNTTGYDNTSVGYQSLVSNTSGSDNSAIGSQSLRANTTGTNNASLGYSALYNNTTGWRNVAVGVSALYYNTTGSNNPALGTYADVSTGNLNNATAIGYYAVVNASNKVVIGNSNVTVIGGPVNWSKLSDGRFKSNIQQNVPGLAFINKLKPVTYNLELKKLDKFLGKKDSLINTLKDLYARGEKKIHTGFVAQEVEKAAKELNYDFDGVNAPANDKDNYSIAYADFVPSLVKSVQELSTQNDSLKKQNDDQQKQIDELKAMMQQYMQGNATTSFSAANMSKKTIIPEEEAMLQQNVPNPVKNITVINYSLPKKFAKAALLITDSNGRTIKQVSLSSGKGSVNIDASMFAAGIYNYSLIVDGKTIASKQMMRIK